MRVKSGWWRLLTSISTKLPNPGTSSIWNLVCSIKNIFRCFSTTTFTERAAIHDETKLWISYPKTASKIVSDLNRDCSWEELYKKDYTCVRQVILDHVWTAMRFIKTSQVPNQEGAFAETNVTHSLSFNKSLVVPPIELGKLFTKHKEAQEFFTSLPVTNQKEYCSWIESAKKAETRQIRLETALERLLAGKNNPAEK